MRAVLMVGGRGVRLRPFTTTIPKPLVPIGGERPILELLLCQLAHFGVTHVTLATGHLGHLIESYVDDGAHWDLHVDYWHDRVPLGTVGPLVEHVDELPETFLLLNGDLLCDLDFADMVDFHVAHDADVTVAAAQRAVGIEYGVLEADGDSLRSFREKPSMEYLVNMGIYVIARDALRSFQPGAALDADQLIADRIAAGRANVYTFDGYWLDIGRPEDYDRANADYPTLRPLLHAGPELIIDLTGLPAPQPT